MRRVAFVGVAFVGFALASLAGVIAAGANVVVNIDKSAQRMSVAVDGANRYSFPVSTGRAGFGTPNGTYRPERLARTWFSRAAAARSEEHTSELQSRQYLVCRLLLEKKK